MERLLTTREAAERAGVGPTAIKRWADQSLLPCVKTAGGHRRFRESDLSEFLKERRFGGGETSEDTSELDRWIDLLCGNASGYEVEARLLGLRGRLGAWYRVAGFVGELLTDLGLRWERGELSVVDEHLASERLARAISRVVESIPSPPSAPLALLACAEGDDHTLGLSCVEMVLREAGYRSRWAGRATPNDEVIAWLEDSEVELVALSASQSSDDATRLAEWVQPICTACKDRSIDVVLGGQGAWPDPPSFGFRMHTFDELHAFITGLRAAKNRAPET